MNILEILLLSIGVLFCLLSFFLTEKLSNRDKEKLQKLSSEQIKEIINESILDAKNKLNLELNDQVESAVIKFEQETNKEYNEKLMNINELADEIKEEIENNQVSATFMHNMLNEKKNDVTEMTKDLIAIKDTIVNLNTSVDNKLARFRDAEIEFEARVNKSNQVYVEPEETLETFDMSNYTEQLAQKNNEDNSVSGNNQNKEIIKLHNEGLSDVEIAKQLGRGLGEVKFVLSLYQEG